MTTTINMTSFFETIITIANERPLKADDFEPFTGQCNWLSFERSEEHGDVSSYPDAPFLSGVVYRFRLEGVAAFGDNMVAITLFHEDGDEERMTMDADELAIRMDES